MKPLLACDTETRGLGGELLGVGFFGIEPFSMETQGQLFSKDELLGSRGFVQKELFDKHTIVFHNAKYDLLILEREGFTIPDYLDTMVLAHLLNPLAPCDLDSVAYRYLGEHKIEIENKAELEWNDETSAYCLQDTKLTYNLAVKLLEELKLCESHYNWAMDYEIPYIEVIREMEGLGLVIDRNRTIEAINEYTDKLNTALDDVRTIAPLIPGKEVIYKKQTEDGFGYYVRNGEVKWNHCLLEEFNPASSAHVIRMLTGLGWKPEKFTPSGSHLRKRMYWRNWF